jgi:long-chain acyl-CoA synthetase
MPSIEKHARIGAIIFSQTPWTIENEILTPTMKIRREQIENTFGEDAERLARDGAEKGLDTTALGRLTRHSVR